MVKNIFKEILSGKMSMSTLPFELALDFLKLVDLVGHQARFLPQSSQSRCKIR